MRWGVLIYWSLLLFPGAVRAQIPLAAGSTVQDFNNLGTGLPTGWSVYTASTVSTLGTPASFTPAVTAWGAAGLGTDFRNSASDNLATNASTSTQASGANRAFGWRPVGGNASEVTPGRTGSLVATFASTSGFILTALSLRFFTTNDVSGSQTYQLEYRLGDTGNFTPIGTAYTTGPPFSATTISADATSLGALSNKTGPVYVRLRGTATSGASNLDTLGVDDFTLTASALPVITTQPTAQSTLAGQTVTFVVAANTTGAATYQWRKNGSAITGNASAATATLQLGAITMTSAGSYDVVVTDSVGSTTSDAATLTINKAAAAITLGVLTATYDGSPHGVSATTSPAGLAVVLSYGGNATPPTNAGTYSVTATISSADYQGSASGTLTITKAAATVMLGSLSPVYTSTPQAASAITIPAGLTVNFTYGGAASPPTNAGAHAVIGTISDVNYQGSTNGTLVIAKANQLISFPGPQQIVQAGVPVTLVATASSGLAPMTFSLVSGNGTLAGPTLTPADASPVTVRATQAGNANYNSAFADLTITPGARVSQSITFVAPDDRPANSGSFSLQATATSGLPIAFAVISGPATLSGDTLTLTGPTGPVTIRATQAGNTIFLAADDVVRPFNATTPLALPVVIFQSVDLAGFAGERLVLAATVGGFPLPTLKWRKNGADIPGATTATLEFASLAPADAGTYELQATNSVGAISSPRLSVSLQKRTQTITFETPITSASAGTGITLGATASSGLPISYAFVSGSGSLGGNVLTGIGGPIVIRATQPGNTTFAAATSVERTLSFLAGGQAPFITSPPLDQTITAGATATFQVSAIGSPPPVFQWQKDGVAIGTDPLLVLPKVTLTDAGRYTVIATNAVGTVSASANLVVQTAPTITIAPTDQSSLVGATATLNAAGTGFPSPAFQWRKNGLSIPGATNPVLTLAHLTAADAGRYDVVVSNAAGTTTSRSATVTVSLPDFSSNSTGPVATSEVPEGLEPSEAPAAERLTNFSTRGFVSPGAPLVAGFALAGKSPHRVLLRGIGPALGAAPFGMEGTLPSPRLTLFRGSAVLKTNDGWSAEPEAVVTRDVAARVGAFPLPPGSLDAAMVIYLEPGTYTAEVSGSANADGLEATGIALIEIYEVTP
ncbi:MAG: hypothetical protein EXS38_09115 [Opitutus sp.]|nr:hypothetical protein [Opitutus sp.]